MSAKIGVREWLDAGAPPGALLSDESGARPLVDAIRAIVEALEAVKEFADAGETQLCWETANDALAVIAQPSSGDPQ